VQDAGITSVSLTADKPLDPVKFENWIGDLRANKGQDLLRYKGILNMAGSNAKLAIQGVHMMMEGSNLMPELAWTELKERRHQRRERSKRPLGKLMLAAALGESKMQ